MISVTKISEVNLPYEDFKRLVAAEVKIEAVGRYVKRSKYISTEDILSILGVDKNDDDVRKPDGDGAGTESVGRDEAN